MISLRWSFNTFHMLLLLLVYLLLKLTSLRLCHQVCAVQCPTYCYQLNAPSGCERIQLHLHAYQWTENGRRHYSRCSDDEAARSRHIRISEAENTAPHKDKRITNSCGSWWLICMQIRLLKIYSIGIRVSTLQNSFSYHSVKEVSCFRKWAETFRSLLRAVSAGAPFQGLEYFNWLLLFCNIAFLYFLVTELLPLCFFKT